MAGALGLTALAGQAQTTALADSPPLSTFSVPGNLALVLSVEFPTAVSVAHTNRTYVAGTQYQGYFDPEKCYTYTYVATDTPATPNTVNPATYFSPVGAAANHLCNVGTATGQWSGNFLNWASMQTIDTFRSVLTGGYRVIDTPSLTVLEKAWNSTDGVISNFPDSTLAATDIGGATPFRGASGMTIRIKSLGNVMRFSVGQQGTYSVTYWNNTPNTKGAMSGTPIGPRTEYGTGAIQSNASPWPNSVNAYDFAARYLMSTTAPNTGTYVFRASADDGVRLSINGTQIIDGWRDQGTTAYTSQGINFNAGDPINIVLDYYQAGGGASLKLEWQTSAGGPFVEVGGSGGQGDVNASSQPWTGNTNNLTSAYDVFVRARVCDSNTGFDAIEAALCTVYGSNAKPEGLLQKYNKKLRYSAFGYLNDNNIQRDGGVLRAAQKFVGPLKPAYGLPDSANPAAEWDASTGVFVRNPDILDATASNVLDSGVLNYIDKFGLFSRKYKTYDPVSELYYAAIRYFKGLSNVPEWSNMAADQAAFQRDGFPVISTWTDPLNPVDWCQKNFILGIGDTNSHADKNVTGPTPGAFEPAKPQAVIADTNSARSPKNAVEATNQVGLMEAAYQTAQNRIYSPTPTSSLGTINPWGDCCSNNSALMAGLAYDSHTTDIRNDFTAKPAGSKVTVDTYWVDVQEAQVYRPNNQYYLATKYGGFTVPTGFDPYTATALPSDSTWWNGVDVDASSGQKRPTNYFPGNSPQSMRAGLGAAFSSIVSAAGQVNSTSFLTALPQVSSSGAASYSAKYDSSTWTGSVIGSNLVINNDGTNTSTPGGDFQANLDVQTARRIVTWSPARKQGVQFQATVAAANGSTALDSTQLAALDTSYTSGNDSAAFLAYLRGSRSGEPPLGQATSTSLPYRPRAHLLGDIVNSKPTVVGRPSFPFADSSNPGYNAFKTVGVAANRPSVVYIGANDGMLHAIDGRLATSAAAANGSELFAYVPNALFQGPNATPNVDGLASLGTGSFVHHYMVDATASSFDVDFNRTTDGTTAPPTSWTPDWHTILIGGLGKGGKVFYALDVTDPSAMALSEVTAASKVLWEFTDPNLGYSYGEPAVAKTRKYGWVVVLPSGYNTADGRGHLFFLNPRTGALLETVDMPSGSGGLAHVDGFVVDATDNTVDAFYAGDLQGNLWRVDVTPAFVSQATRYSALLLARLTDGSSSSAPQPITTRPTIAVDPGRSGSRYVMVGTGRLLDSTDVGTAQGQTQTFYAFIDGTNAAFNATAAAGVNFPLTRSQLANGNSTTTDGTPSAAVIANPFGWYVDLIGAQAGPPARMLYDATVDFGRIALPITQPVGSSCAPGGVGQVYAFNFGTGQSVLFTNGTNNLTTLMAYQTVAYNVTEARFISADGNAKLIYGSNGTTTQQQIMPNASAQSRRINWREVPTAD